MRTRRSAQPLHVVDLDGLHSVALVTQNGELRRTLRRALWQALPSCRVFDVESVRALEGADQLPDVLLMRWDPAWIEDTGVEDWPEALRRRPVVLLTEALADAPALAQRGISLERVVRYPCEATTVASVLRQVLGLDGCAGHVHGLPLFDLLQALHLARASLTLLVSHGASVAEIVCLQGEVVHASMAGRSGKEVLLEVLTWPSCRYFSCDGAAPSVCSIRVPLEQMLLEAAHRLDVPQAAGAIAPTGLAAATLRPDDTEAMLPHDASEPSYEVATRVAASDMEPLQVWGAPAPDSLLALWGGIEPVLDADLLADMQQMQGVEVLAVMHAISADVHVMLGMGWADETLPDVVADLIMQAGRCMRALRDVDAEEVVLHGADLWLLLQRCCLTPQYVILTLRGDASAFGMARHCLRRFARELDETAPVDTPQMRSA
ncbi:MAG: DUF4388 domain-containing protein [Polyangiales bacterium]